MQTRPWATQVCWRVTQVRPRARMILVFPKPTWILQTPPRVEEDEKIIRYNYILLYVMIIVNWRMVSLVFNKMLCCLKCQYTFVICCLCELCFNKGESGMCNYYLFIWLNDQVIVHSANPETNKRLLNGLNDKSRCQIDRSRSLGLSATPAFQVAGHFLSI